MALPARRRSRTVTKLQLDDLQGIDAEALGAMLREGPVEIIVAVQDGAAWGDTLGRFFGKLEADIDGWRSEVVNRTVIVNFVDRG